MPLIAQQAHAQANNCENVKFGFGHYSKPQNTGRDIIGQSLDDIQERGWISIAVYEAFPPYSYKKDGKLVGVDIDLGNLIAKDLGVEARFYVTAAGENVDADLRNNVWKGKIIGGRVANVMMHIPYNKELICRNEQVVLGGHYFNEKVAIAYAKEHYPDGGPVPAFFRFDEVGVENDTIADFYLSGIGNGQLIPKMKRYATTQDAMIGLENGEVKAVMGPLGQLEHGLTDKLAVHTPPLVGLGVGEWTLSVATNFRWRPLGYAVEDTILAAIQDGRME
ncbi:MAG: transporter substrate-binding domain-containing protein, partial [Rhizobiaceae bacterium]|nr:transporter substrate-binding domain-containing protein [Rhizobiaceae bacterium]